MGIWFDKRRAWPGIGANPLFMVGFTVIALGLSVLAIDMPLYFDTQNQLQTAANAAALAGAAALPEGEAEAEEAAMEYATENMVAGHTLNPADLVFDYDGSTFMVKAETQVPTMMARFLCSTMSAFNTGGGPDAPAASETGGGDGEDSAETSCEFMTIAATAKAMPAARDVVLVIDASTSMDNLGNGQPFKDIKTAALAYVDQVIALDSESVDRIGVVRFHYGADKPVGLTSTYDSSGFTTVKNAITNLKIYTPGSSWNTNYHAGLKMALDELENNGRENANKTIVFLTDGYPNLPDGDWNYVDCINAENSGDSNMNQYNYWKTRNTAKANSYYTKAQQKYQESFACASGYTGYMSQVTQAQADRAEEMGVTIHTIRIGGDMETSPSYLTLKDMLNDDDWDPMLIEYIAETTGGEQYAAQNYDGPAILEIYQSVAQDVHMRLAN